MRRLALTLLFMMMALPVQATGLQESTLPVVMEKALLDAAATGNPLVIEATADRLSRLFPASKSAINLYVAEIVAPASLVMVAVDQMIVNSPTSFAFYNSDAVYYPEREEIDPAIALAAEFNDLDVGAGTSDL